MKKFPYPGGGPAGADVNEHRFTSFTLTQASLSGTGQRRPPGTYYGCVAGVYSLTAGAPAVVDLLLEGSNDNTNWFVLAQCDPATRFVNDGDKIVLNAAGEGIVEFERFAYIRARAAVISGNPTFSLEVEVAGQKYGGDSLIQTATLTRTGASVASSAFVRPNGACLTTAQATMSGINLGAASSILAVLQGSPDGGTTWFTFAQTSFTANGAKMVQVGDLRFLSLGGFYTFRWVAAEVGGVATAYSIEFNLCWDNMDAKTGNDGAGDGPASEEVDEVLLSAVGSVGAEVGNVVRVTFQLLKGDGSPVTDSRRLHLYVYDTSGAGVLDLSTNGTITAVATGTAKSALRSNQIVADTDATGILAVDVTDLAAETIYAMVDTSGVNNPTHSTIVAKCTEATLVYT